MVDYRSPGHIRYASGKAIGGGSVLNEEHGEQDIRFFDGALFVFNLFPPAHFFDNQLLLRFHAFHPLVQENPRS